jgi:outer membrane protein assembly factor BamD
MLCYRRGTLQSLVIDVLLSRLAAMLLILTALAGCSLFESGPPPVDPATVPVDKLYSQGIDQMKAEQYDTANKTFRDLEQTYPYSSLATNAQLMQAYSAYMRNNYTDALAVLDRFIQLHPAYHDIAYVYYLRALCYYEQIADIQRDQKNTQDAMAALQEVVNRFPDSPYARDAKLKIDLARDHLAGKEMEIGRYYESQKLYTAAIGRFQRVVTDYQTTNHVPEALQRLTEIYLLLGLPEEAKKTAAVLGHNYPGSRWYQDAYNQLISAGVISADAVKPEDRPSWLDRNVFSIF